ncbi:hypothetical protein ASE83_10215 [Sphingomonas sp. Leaf32]|nr:hypothetical protein ASE83_10215 [Sphingomonas sp. Leaf32]
MKQASSPNETDEGIGDILSCHHDDPDRALAYVILGATRSDDPGFLTGLGCGPLEDVLRNPSNDLLAGVVAEARRSAGFRWLLGCPFQAAIAAKAWDAFRKFHMTGPHAQPD